MVFASRPPQITTLIETKHAEKSEKFFGVSDFRPERTLELTAGTSELVAKADFETYAVVEQTRTESRQVTVSRGGGSVSWGPGVTFGGGVSVMGVPIDPRTQMPVPNNVAQTQVITWVDFRFKDNGMSVPPFIETSLKNVEKIYRDLQPHI